MSFFGRNVLIENGILLFDCDLIALDSNPSGTSHQNPSPLEGEGGARRFGGGRVRGR